MARKRKTRKKKGFPWLVMAGGLGVAALVGYGVYALMKPKGSASVGNGNGVPTGQMSGQTSMNGSVNPQQYVT